MQGRSALRTFIEKRSKIDRFCSCSVNNRKKLWNKFRLFMEHKQKRPIWNVSLLFPIETCSQKRVYVYVPLLTRGTFPFVGTFLINKTLRKLISRPCFFLFFFNGSWFLHNSQFFFADFVQKQEFCSLFNVQSSK